jgi:hypothetical protein
VNGPQDNREVFAFFSAPLAPSYNGAMERSRICENAGRMLVRARSPGSGARVDGLAIADILLLRTRSIAAQIKRPKAATEQRQVVPPDLHPDKLIGS